MRRNLPIIALLSLSPLSAFASGEAFKVAEIFAGAQVEPNAQYIMLRSVADGQSEAIGQVVTVVDLENNTITYTLPNLRNGNNQARVLLATPEAEAFFGITADVEIAPGLDPSGGEVCLGIFDCASWGAYYDGNGDLPFSGQNGVLPSSLAMTRVLDRSGGAFSLEPEDDFNISAEDFTLSEPTPVNNAGLSGQVPASTCGDGQLSGNESCDDGNTTEGDGCGASCAPSYCGDGIVQPELGEQCDSQSYYIDEYTYCDRCYLYLSYPFDDDYLMPCSVAPAEGGLSLAPLLLALGLLLLRRRS